jgi:N utilization substance protein A
VRELRNENIDVINYSSNPEILIGRALNLSRVPQMRLNQETKKAEVFLHPDEISLAIGKGGLNIKLASMITGYEIDVYREGIYENEEDIYLDDFSDEIDSWIIDALKNIGCITAKAVINTPRQDLIDKADLEEDTVDEILQILNAEFED